VTQDSPWDAGVDLGPWCAALADQVERWRPSPMLGLERRRLVEEVVRAAAERAAWLLHPCLNAITYASSDHRAARDVLFATWVAAHAGSDLGAITLARPFWRWSRRGGGVLLAAGRYDLDSIARSDGPAPDPPQNLVESSRANDAVERPGPAIDLYCRSLGFSLPAAWPDPHDAGESEPPLALRAAREIAHAIAVLARALPTCFAWAAAVTHVVVPLPSTRGEWSSGSQADLPGLVHCSGLHGPVVALEALVHESAHHRFTLLEAGGPLADPDHDDLYPSPLRTDPRPLGRVLLAVHALWHVTRFYDDALACSCVGPEWGARRAHLRRLLADGLSMIERTRSHLTSLGAEMTARWLAP
jgi:HEXXH motif-containing protein